jgi:tRNA-binding protein
MSTSETSPRIPADSFFRNDIRVGRVISVEEFPKARKPAYKITVDFGPAGKLRTSAQITNYTPEELADRLVVGVINLEVKRIAGFASEFLLLGSYDVERVVHLLSPGPEAVPGDQVG